MKLYLSIVRNNEVFPRFYFRCLAESYSRKRRKNITHPLRVHKS